MIRPWPLICRTNQTCRPVAVDLEVDYNKSVCIIKINFKKIYKKIIFIHEIFFLDYGNS